MTRAGSKEALAQQRAAVRRGARGKAHVGDDTGAAASRAAELARVRRLQDAHRAEERARERAYEQARLQEQDHAARMQEPMLAIALDLASDGLRIVRTLVALPFRVAFALLPWRRHAAV